jgi:lactoylglutathione lyase
MQNVNYVIIFVSDMKRSIEFYREVLGLELRMESPKWTEFATGTATLALHGVEEDAAKRSVVAEMVPGYCNPGFTVEDLDAFHKRMKAHGVPCPMPPTVEEYGVKLATYADPDGLRLTVAEMMKK